MTRDDMTQYFASVAASVPTDRMEAALYAQLDPDEDPNDLPPARFATLATRASLLSRIPIDWESEVARAALFPAGFLESLALKLGAGEIEPHGALEELTEREAEITCRIGGLYLAEVLRRLEHKRLCATPFVPPDPVTDDRPEG